MTVLVVVSVVVAALSVALVVTLVVTGAVADARSAAQARQTVEAVRLPAASGQPWVPRARCRTLRTQPARSTTQVGR